MRIFIYNVLFMCMSVNMLAQMPQALNFQALARTVAGNVLLNQTVRIRLSIQGDAPGNQLLYSETRDVLTNQLGVFNIQLGSPGALSTSGNFSAINWVNNTSIAKNIKIEMDATNSGVFSDMGTQRFSSIPFAFAVDQTLNTHSIGGNYVSAQVPVAGDKLKWDGTAWVPSQDSSYWALNGNAMYSKNHRKVGIGTSNATARLFVKDSSVLFEGPADIFAIQGAYTPIETQGTRMLWFAQKGAFRVGTVSGSEWAGANIGLNSVVVGKNSAASAEDAIVFGNDCFAPWEGALAMGKSSIAASTVAVAIGDSCIAQGTASTAMGKSSTTTGNFSVAIGYNADAFGIKSTAFGTNTLAYGESSTVFNLANEARGKISTAMGIGTKAYGYASLYAGNYNYNYAGIQTSVTSFTPLFLVGNGSSDASRSTAMLVQYDGKVGIGVNSPTGLFDLSMDQARKPGSFTWTITSDERLKQVEGPYTKGLDEIVKLKPIRYHYHNADGHTFSTEVLNTACVGYSAQAVSKVFPESVGTDADGFLNLNTHALLVAYTNAIQALNRQGETEQALIDQLQRRITALELK